MASTVREEVNTLVFSTSSDCIRDRSPDPCKADCVNATTRSKKGPSKVLLHPLLQAKKCSASISARDDRISATCYSPKAPITTSQIGANLHTK